jgi:RHS repeat-associated protein
MPGQDYAMQRYYSGSTGAFWTPDPGGIKTADSISPNSWNRYAYVNGDPVNKLDPSGKIACDAGDDDGCAADAGDTDNDCDDDGCVDDDGGGGTADCTVLSDGTVSCPTTTVVVTATPDPVKTPGPDTSTNFWTIPDVPIYGWMGQGANILGAAGRQASHDLGCVGIPAGTAAAGAGLYKLGQPVVGSKPFVTPGSSLGTSPVSAWLRNLLPGRLPFRIPTPVGGPGTGVPVRISWSNQIGPVLGRYAPIVGIAGVVASAATVNSCLQQQ